MCGIAGYILREGKAGADVVRAMCDQIRHRGPDDEGFHVEGGCALSMHRLSIIDLSTGHQPISNEDGSVWVVFNGEIYDYQRLRRNLAARGHRFSTNTDTEALAISMRTRTRTAWPGFGACSLLPSGMRPGAGSFWPATASARNPCTIPRCRRACTSEAS